VREPIVINDPLLRRMARILLWLAILIGGGTLGYAVLERWPLRDGFFMTVITLSTVGYGETHNLSPLGRWFTTGLIFCCIVGMTCWTAVLTSFVVENEISGRYIRRRMMKMASQIKEHTIVCGSGMMANVVLDRLMRKRLPVVVIDECKDRLEELRQKYRSLVTIEGNATNEMTLAEAGLLSASNVVAAMDNDVDNLLVVITCKDSGRDIRVLARSNDISIANRMRKAGADEIISPCLLSGNRVAEVILA
jgi:voltage-gated potassium channel